jgi:hypothetical protein
LSEMGSIDTGCNLRHVVRNLPVRVLLRKVCVGVCVKVEMEMDEKVDGSDVLWSLDVWKFRRAIAKSRDFGGQG